MSNKLSLSRRRFVTTGVTVAATLKLQQAALGFGFNPGAAVCSLAAEQESGPFFIADELLRSDISEDRTGVPLLLRVIVLDVRTCKALANAAVDVWHCDALGLYSGFTKQNPAGPGGPPPSGFDTQHPGNPSAQPEGTTSPPPGGRPPEHHPTEQLTFLRGIQVSDDHGAVSFWTIFPGVYMGRTNHIHFKVRLGGRIDARSYAAEHTSHTGQIFFPEELAAKLMSFEPYSKHEIHRTTQAEDQVYNGQGGMSSMARITSPSGADIRQGLRAELIAAVDPTATPLPARRQGGPGR